MTLATVVTGALLVCCLPAFTQDQRTGTVQIPGNGISSFVTNRDAAPTPSEPWRIIPNRPSDLNSDSMGRIPIPVDQYRLEHHSKAEAKTRSLAMGLDGLLDDDATCYTMRSYVVARDSKNSDSTHITGYSTCQRASRYHLKTTEIRPVLAEP
jgi:hypothetical protein